jgi:hypothetical protein
MTPKTAPCFVHSGWYQDITPMTLPAPASILSATQTPFIAGPLVQMPAAILTYSSEFELASRCNLFYHY